MVTQIFVYNTFTTVYQKLQQNSYVQNTVGFFFPVIVYLKMPCRDRKQWDFYRAAWNADAV